MVQFTTIVKRFDKQGEKTGWTYIEVPQAIAQQLKPGNKKSFRVKGMLDQHPISSVALIPMGEGDFILALNAAMRKATGKSKGYQISVKIDLDTTEIKAPKDFMDCLSDEPDGLIFYKSLAQSHQLYFIRWIESAKTDPTRTKRIAQAVSALAAQQPFDKMLRALKKEKDLLK
jgi:hypothetical protein